MPETGREHLTAKLSAARLVESMEAQGRGYVVVSLPSKDLPTITLSGAHSLNILIGKTALELFHAKKASLEIELYSEADSPFIYVGRYQGTINLKVRSNDCAFVLEDCKNINMMVQLYEASYMHVGRQCSSNSCDATISGASIIFGQDCMLSHDIVLQPSDQHDIYDAETGNLLNTRRSIVLEDHVWLAKGAYVGAGVRIGSGAIVGARAVVVKAVEGRSIVAGNPAREIRKGVTWSRDFTTKPSQ